MLRGLMLSPVATGSCSLEPVMRRHGGTGSRAEGKRCAGKSRKPVSFKIHLRILPGKSYAVRAPGVHWGFSGKNPATGCSLDAQRRS